MPSSGSRAGTGRAARAVALAVALLLTGVGLAVAAPVGPPRDGTAGAAGVPRLVANITATPPAGPIPLTVQFVGNGSGTFSPYSYSWSFGDGSAVATGKTVSHTYRWTGAFVVNLTVTDYYGATAVTSVTVRAGPAVLAASLVASPDSVGIGGRTVLTVNVTGGVTPYSFAWTGLPGGCPTLDVEVLSCQPTQSGSFSVDVVVTDATGDSTHVATTLTVIGNLPPPPPPATSAAAGPLLFEVGGVAAVAVGAAAGLLWRRRRGGSRTGPAA